MSRVGKTDGRLFPITEGDLVPGAVLRMRNPGDDVSAFSDCLVVSSSKDGTVKLARPYAFVTRGATVLTGVEQFTVPIDRLLSNGSIFAAVVQTTGLVAKCRH